MRELFTIEHGKAAYLADFAFYVAAIAALGSVLFGAAPAGSGTTYLVLSGLGFVSWTLMEYLLHRFVLHGVLPFKRWHEEHHRRPRALICAPTMLSACLVLLLVFLPCLALGNAWHACAFTLGVVTGYLLYAVTHHATHHWQAKSPWLRKRKRWHALHHHFADSSGGGYGVSTAFWDHVFASAHPSRPR